MKFDSAQPRKTEISVWVTGYQLNPGHKLRVFIASSWKLWARLSMSVAGKAESTSGKIPDKPESQNLIPASLEIFAGN